MNSPPALTVDAPHSVDEPVPAPPGAVSETVEASTDVKKSADSSPDEFMPEWGSHLSEQRKAELTAMWRASCKEYGPDLVRKQFQAKLGVATEKTFSRAMNVRSTLSLVQEQDGSWSFRSRVSAGQAKHVGLILRNLPLCDLSAADELALPTEAQDALARRREAGWNT